MDVRGRRRSHWFTFDNPWNSFDPDVAGAEIPSPAVEARHHRRARLCAGGAQYFLNESDIIICSDDAVFFDPHANVGIVARSSPIGMLHRGVPLGDVLRWALMGTEERITAATALRIGLVTEVRPRASSAGSGEGDRGVDRWRDSKAVQGTVRAIWESLEMPRKIAINNGLPTRRSATPRQNPAAPRNKCETQYR